MALPAKIKSYTHTVNNRSTFASVAQVQKEILHGLKNAIKAMPGVTVKGSSNGTTAAMDAVDRFTVATDWSNRAGNVTTAASWIVFDMPGMDNIELCLAYIGASGDQQARIAFAPANDYALAGTPTFQPTCTNEQVVLNGADLQPATASLDRLWNVVTSSDGSTVMWFVARSSAIANGGVIQKISSQVLAPATYAQAVIGHAFTANPSVTNMTNGTVNGVSRCNGASVSALFCTEFFNNNIAPVGLTNPSDLQSAGTGYLLYPVGAWSATATARGKLGSFFDLYFGLSTAADGDVYTDDAGVTKPWINVGDIVLPWNNSTPVLA